jgi:prepilin-type N-terminal cleavage/methylation domain-containing protein
MRNSLRASASARGFSLLELMIVLVLMVGLLAIAWPNMQRSLRRTTLNEAAQTLREAIDEGRNEALTTGRPVFVQMQQGNHEVRTGSYANFANDDEPNNTSDAGLASDHDSNHLSSTVSQSELHSATKSPRKWRLPDSVVIAEVNWTTEPHSATEEASGIDSSSEFVPNHASPNIHDESSNAQNHDSSSNTPSSNEEFLASLDGEHSDWWLPISATGQSRSASIVLYDKSLHETMTITYASDTGALEIVR